MQTVVEQERSCPCNGHGEEWGRSQAWARMEAQSLSNHAGVSQSVRVRVGSTIHSF